MRGSESRGYLGDISFSWLADPATEPDRKIPARFRACTNSHPVAALAAAPIFRFRRQGLRRTGPFLGSAVKAIVSVVPRSTVDWDTSQADNFRRRAEPWTIKRTRLERV